MTRHAMPIFEHTDASHLTKKDFTSDQEVKWCPGCGDYAILAQVQRTLPSLGIPRENFVVVSGIGCSSRFPYYMNTYGMHSIHGRAPAFASAIKSVRPELSVWVATGDGDGLSIGGNHMLHVLRRNVDLKILLFNNRIYGLTKGQYSPTSEQGKRTGSTPVGSIDYPLDPVKFALGAGSTFVARALDVDAKAFQEVLLAAARHRGSAFVEILQNCPIYNDDTWIQISDKKTRPEHALYLETGKKLLFGAEKDRGIGLDATGTPLVVPADDPRVLVHDPGNESQSLAISRLADFPGMPKPLGVVRAVSRPTYDEMLNAQVAAQREARGGSLQDLLEGGETWRIG